MRMTTSISWHLSWRSRFETAKTQYWANEVQWNSSFLPNDIKHDQSQQWSRNYISLCVKSTQLDFARIYNISKTLDNFLPYLFLTFPPCQQIPLCHLCLCCDLCIGMESKHLQLSKPGRGQALLEGCWWRKSGNYQRVVVYPMIYRVLKHIPDGARMDFTNLTKYDMISYNMVRWMIWLFGCIVILYTILLRRYATMTSPFNMQTTKHQLWHWCLSSPVDLHP